MKRFEPLNGADYSCFFVWSLLQIIGVHWTFEHVPMDWLTTIFGISEIKKERV